jgi:hypothetical protein
MRLPLTSGVNRQVDLRVALLFKFLRRLASCSE